MESNKKSFKDSWNSFTDFFIVNKRYFLAGIVFIGIIYILTFCVGKNVTEQENKSGVYQAFSVDANKEVNALVQRYYLSYASGDTTGMTAYTTDLSDGEVSYIQTMSAYIESFSNIKVYTKPGTEEGSYFCSVYMEEKFVGIDTLAPGLDFFYIRTNKDGMLYIDNNYSAFNQANNETEMDPDILALIQTYYEQSDVVALADQVQSQYDEALKSDKALKKFVEETLIEAINNWKANWTTQKKQQKAIEEAKQKEAEEAKAAEEAAAAEQKAQEEAAAASQKALNKELKKAKDATITEKVRYRDNPSTDGNVLGNLEAGTAVKVLSTTDDGWSKIYVNDSVAYVKSDYVSVTGTATTDTTAQTTTQTTNTVTIKKAEVNVRQQASQSGSLVCRVHSGDVVTVVGTSGEWTQIKFGNYEGYIRSDMLQ